MAARYICGDEQRRARVREHNESPGEEPLNGIDFLEVADRQLLAIDEGEPLRQKVLLVRLFLEVPAGLAAIAASPVAIAGGVRVPVRVLWVLPAAELAAAPEARVPAAEKAPITAVLDAILDAIPEEERTPILARTLVVRTDAGGDHSIYRLRLVPPDGERFDPRLLEVAFSFKVECASDFDCRRDPVCLPPERAEPEISYLAKDYASFRRLMLDRLSAIAPDWRERNPADLGIALVELLAYVGDQLSYYQDAVATEAYLGTARRRTSVRRHARLVDYFLHEGANARAWMMLTVDSGPTVEILGPDPEKERPGMPVVSRVPWGDRVLTPGDLDRAARDGAVICEALQGVKLTSQHNEILFYTWSDDRCCLPAGATEATLQGPLPDLARHDLLLFEEVASPRTGAAEDADPRRRHVVRLTEVTGGTDPLTGQAVVDVRWDAADALPFPLCLSAVTDEDHDSRLVDPVSVARGNVVPVDHGRTLHEDLGRVVEGEPFQPVLAEGPVTWGVPLPEDIASRPAALLARAASPREARPAVRLLTPASGEVWTARRDLLGSDRFAADFRVEPDEEGRSRLRFGDDVDGKAPDAGTAFTATYRVGNGLAGNAGAEALSHVVLVPELLALRTDLPPADAERDRLERLDALKARIRSVRNPLPAFGGTDPEDLEEARQFAPQAFRVQQRAVTEADYAEVAERHPEVQKAVATFRWTGSWITVFLTVDRIAGRPVDDTFEVEMHRHLERFRMAGHDVEIDRPHFAPLDVALRVCVASGHLRSHVKAALLERLGRGLLRNGRRAFFHPDEWVFGQPVWLSRLYAAAAEVEGVESVEVVRFQRQDRLPARELEDGVLRLGRLEIARLDNDPDFQENGRLELDVRGGR